MLSDNDVTDVNEARARCAVPIDNTAANRNLFRVLNAYKVFSDKAPAWLPSMRHAGAASPLQRSRHPSVRRRRKHARVEVA